MAKAEVGDDYYGEDPTVNRLQEQVARLLGFEAALFVPAGTMGNEIAIRILTRPGDQVVVEERSHVVEYELSGMAVLSGVVPRMVRAPDGILTPPLVRRVLKPATLNRAAATLLIIENTHNLAGGVITPVAEMRALISSAREAGLHVHIDGARLWNAAVALGVAPSELIAGADSVMVTLSKGLCCPAGSLLAASRERIEAARRVRQQLGGGMRQAGILAAAGLVALETMIARLGEDHANARLLATALEGRRGVEGVPAQTNIVVARLALRTAPEIVAAFKARGVLASAMDTETLRFVTHNDVSRAECERAAAEIAAVLG